MKIAVPLLSSICVGSSNWSFELICGVVKLAFIILLDPRFIVVGLNVTDQSAVKLVTWLSPYIEFLELSIPKTRALLNKLDCQFLPNTVKVEGKGPKD